MTKKLVAALAVAAILGAAAPRVAVAQEKSGAVAATPALYDALGAQDGVATLVEDFTRRLVVDARTAAAFREVDLAHFRAQLAAQFCEVAGGPCVYKGKDMKTIHSGIDITRTDFNAVVEMLQRSMDAQGIAFGTQNRLLARLAPMHRDVVNARPGADAASGAAN